MTDVTAIATAGISAGAALAGAWLQSLTSTRAGVERRRRERKRTYTGVIDLLADYGWRTLSDPSFSANVIQDFTIPFVHAAGRVRLYCSPASIAAIDSIQEAFAALNAAATDEEVTRAESRRAHAFDMFIDAARADVGPRRQDGLAPRSFRDGAGPLT